MSRQYIGARYVPIFAEPLAWDITKNYDALTIVQNNNDTYTSRKAVPSGTAITNTEYWVKTGNYNAQLQEYIEVAGEAAGKADEALTKVNKIITNKVAVTFKPLTTAGQVVETTAVEFDAPIDITNATHLRLTTRVYGAGITGDTGSLGFGEIRAIGSNERIATINKTNVGTESLNINLANVITADLYKVGSQWYGCFSGYGYHWSSSQASIVDGIIMGSYSPITLPNSITGLNMFLSGTTVRMACGIYAEFEVVE